MGQGEILPENFFSEEFFREVRYLNFHGFSGELDRDTLSGMDWFQSVHKHFRKFSEKCDRLLIIYLNYIDPEIIELFESTINSKFSLFIDSISTVRKMRVEGAVGLGIIPQEGAFTLLSDENALAMLKEYVNYFLKIIKFYDHYLPAQDKIVLYPRYWDDDISPKVGSSRTAIEAGASVRVGAERFPPKG